MGRHLFCNQASKDRECSIHSGGTKFRISPALLNIPSRLCGLRAQRRAGYKISHIAMSQEDPNIVGEMGADIVKGGKLPSGEKYTWVKRRKEVFTENK